MKKTIMIVIAIMVIILAGIIVGKSIDKSPIIISANSENIGNNTNETSYNNIVLNKNIESNEINNFNDSTINNIITNNIENKEEINTKTDLEKAIDIVKKEWGEDDTVYFAQDGETGNGEIIICVRDNNTTGARAWYSVNITAGTAEKWE